MWIRILMDPHWFVSLDPGPRWGKKLDPDTYALKPMRIHSTGLKPCTVLYAVLMFEQWRIRKASETFYRIWIRVLYKSTYLPNSCPKWTFLFRSRIFVSFVRCDDTYFNFSCLAAKNWVFTCQWLWKKRLKQMFFFVNKRRSLSNVGNSCMLSINGSWRGWQGVGEGKGELIF
jgi:hypothetical protein